MLHAIPLRFIGLSLLLPLCRRTTKNIVSEFTLYIYIYTAVTQLTSISAEQVVYFTLLSSEFLLVLISRFGIATIHGFDDLESRTINSVCIINCQKSKRLCCVHVLLHFYSRFSFFFHSVKINKSWTLSYSERCTKQLKFSPLATMS